MGFRLTRVLALLFGSGACALIYQVAWFRELRLIFGASTAASAAVLAVFMGGLGAGGAVLGKRVDRTENGLAFYAKLEVGVACLAGLTPLLVTAADRIYIATGGSVTLGLTGATLLRLLLSVVILAPPTFLMGGTLPAAARAVEEASDPERRRVAALYGVNTFGAVTGAVLANFVLLEVLGTRLTLWCAALLNMLVGVVARALSRSAAHAAGVEKPTKDLRSASSAEPAVADLVKWFPPFAAALAGFAFMLMELVWYRMLAPILGGSSYTFGLILAVALAGIGIGGALYARTRWPSTLLAFATTCSLEALFIGLPYALGDRVAIAAAALRPACHLGFSSSVLVWTGLCALIVLPAAIVSGAQFPLVMGLYGRGESHVGRDVGQAYLANTLGAITGALAGGFGLMPLLGATRCWRIVVVSLAAGALLAVAVDARMRRVEVPSIVRSIGLAIIATALLLSPGPSAVWRHSGIGAGRADPALGRIEAPRVDRFVREWRRAIKWEKDGVESSVALGYHSGYAFIVNGKIDGHAITDAGTQVMSGLLPAMLHPGVVKNVLVVGLGTGSTAGWLGKVPSVDRVDVVELEPAILDVARDCAPVNENVLENPKVHVRLADAREVLRATPGRYDIIFSEPSNPYRSGISSMYTVEYYRAAAERLDAGGLFVQWMQAYEVDGWAVATALVTLRQVFAEVEVWETMPGDFLLVARREHSEPIDVAKLHDRLATEPFARAAHAVWRTASAEGILAHFMAQPKLADILVERGLGAVNTDDQNLLEFAFARSVGRANSVDSDFRALAERLGLARPPITGEVDWNLVDEERWLYEETDGAGLDPPASARPDRLGHVVESYLQKQYLPAWREWKALGRKPMSLGEAAIVSDLAARFGGPDDEPLLEGAPNRVERELVQAAWYARHGDGAAAVDALDRGFHGARTVPFVRRSVMESALSLAGDIGTKETRHARRLYMLLREPFAVEMLRDARLVTAAKLADATNDLRLCVQGYSAIEVPINWDQKLLAGRARCYRAAGDPRARGAESDLLDLIARDGAFGFGIPSPPRLPQREEVHDASKDGGD